MACAAAELPLLQELDAPLFGGTNEVGAPPRILLHALARLG
jgi:hypothetical protein